jgi:hypothetical protein
MEGLMQVQKCDECGVIGVPGETWVTVSVAPHYLRGNSNYYAEDSPMEVGPGPSRGGTVCSPACAVTRMRRGFEDLATYAHQMLDGLSLLEHDLSEQKAVRYAETSER